MAKRTIRIFFYPREVDSVLFLVTSCNIKLSDNGSSECMRGRRRAGEPFIYCISRHPAEPPRRGMGLHRWIYGLFRLLRPGVKEGPRN